MSSVTDMKLGLAFLAIALLSCGCVSHSDGNSLTLPAAMINVTSAPLGGDFKPVPDVSKLKCGKSEEVMFFRWPYPMIDLVTTGNEALKSAVRNGGLEEVYFADYTQRHYFLVSFFTVRAYGR